MDDLIHLANAGPIAILLVGIAALAGAFIRGMVVPGWIYRQERAQREKAETQAERNSDSLAAWATWFRTNVDGLRGRDGPPDRA